jgi:hypothetical protein
MLEFYIFQSSVNIVSVSCVQWHQTCFSPRYLVICNIDSSSQLGNAFIPSFIINVQNVILKITFLYSLYDN